MTTIFKAAAISKRRICGLGRKEKLIANSRRLLPK
jgi:hypothetical protein